MIIIIKMSHSDIIIIITITLFVSSTVGVYAGVRYIHLHSRPPINTLRRRGDIELQNIEPSTNNNLDLLQPQPVYTIERIPSTIERVPCISEATCNTSEVITSN
jgi:hypothetical protein